MNTDTLPHGLGTLVVLGEQEDENNCNSLNTLDSNCLMYFTLPMLYFYLILVSLESYLQYTLNYFLKNLIMD